MQLLLADTYGDRMIVTDANFNEIINRLKEYFTRYVSETSDQIDQIISDIVFDCLDLIYSRG